MLGQNGNQVSSGGPRMEKVVTFIDRVSETVGKTFAWLVLGITLAMSYEIISRRLAGRPTTWAFDFSYMSYGMYFMLGSAYTLSRNAHVRGDIFYRNFSPRTQATIDLVLYLVVFFPAMIALTWVGWQFFFASYRLHETSPLSPDATPEWPLSAAVPAGAALATFQRVVHVRVNVSAV